MKFIANIFILDMKRNYLRLQYNNSFYVFKNQLAYTLAYYFAESITIKDNVNKFLSNLLIAFPIKKLFY